MKAASTLNVSARNDQLLRFGALAATMVLLAFGVWEGAFVWSAALGHEGTVGLDLTMYLERTRDTLAGDGFYRARQLAGPYPIVAGDSMYPPVLLWLLVPFVVLPAPLWWAIPLGLLGAALWRIRPTVWTWPILAAILVYPRTWEILLYGNPALWALAFLAAAFAWPAFGPFVALKLTFAPFALVGVRCRAWWIGAAVGLALCLPFGALWLDYATALLNARNTFGLIYPLGEWPIALALVAAAWSGRT